ncbi:oligomeric, coiled-coil, peripheral membrane protein [Ceratobasidium sp. 423]|nr:oligomeric, coiled-coil, peripheral membrane protein [Ceratobasidium sp. 423]
MRIIVAEEGKELQPDASFQEIYQQGNLSLALQSLTGIAPAAQLIYSSTGEQLREDNAEELLSALDLTLYVFNRDLLDAGPNPPNELLIFDGALPTSGNVKHDVEMYLQHICSLGISVGVQHQALSIVLRNLESHVMVLVDAFDSFRNVAQRELDRQQSLLDGHKLDLEVISKVKIHPEFLSATVRRGVEAAGRERTLGDYVSGSKMQMVAESCARLHSDLSARYGSVAEVFNQLATSVTELKSKIETEFSSNAALLVDQAEEVIGSLGDGTRGANVAGSQSNMVQLYLDMCNIKNKSTEHVFLFLSEVSDIQRLMSSIPETLATLESDFRQKGGFPHLQRLHSMLYMYGATLVEVVRRREFSRFFMEKAQAIAEVLAKISSHERKRRQVYRSEVHGQLPFEPRGMDEPAPTMEISTSGGEEPAITMERHDIAVFLELISQIERSSNLLTLPPGVSNPTSEARLAFERLIAKLDNLESDFDRLAERAVLSTSRIYQSRRQLTSDQSTMHEVIEQLRETQAAKIEQDIAFQRETAALKAEIERLKQEAAGASAGKQRLERLEIELDVNRAKHATELATRQGLEQRLKDSERARNALQHEVDQLRAGAQANDIAKQDAGKINMLEEQRAELEVTLDRLQIQNRRLEEDLELMRREKDDLNQIIRDKDAILKEQVSAAERSLRDHIAETDGDRAVLEQQVAELRHALDNHNSTEIQKLQLQVSRLEEDKQQLEATLSTSNETTTKLAAATHDLYTSQTQALLVAQNLLKASRANSNGLDGNPNQSLEAPLPPTATIEIPAPLPDFDPDHPQATIDALTTLDPKVIEEAVAKIGTNARKYLKLSKEYRERSKSKITFRNFARGDLALFLPTRNSIAKPWAAFNVAFPHYFLNATEDISELLKSREWIVARIVSITERIADSKRPNGNPFGLGDGVKFHLLDVEDWTQPSNAVKKRMDSNPARPLSIVSYEARERISSWTETTALATGLPQSMSDKEGTSPGASGSPGQKFGPRPPSPPRYFSKMSVSPSAGPSSLSKVLAQAPVPSSPHPSSTFSNQRNANAERSRSRTTSLSSVRPPQFNGSSKAAATTALTDPAVPVATSAATPEPGTIPSPSGSAFEGMSSVALAQRRPTSISPGISAGSTLANIASNLGLPIKRQRVQEQARASPALSEIE